MKIVDNKNNILVVVFLLITSLTFAQSNKSTEEKRVKEDNTAINARDKKALTADEQAYGSAKDVELTRKIRQEIISQKNLSTYAHNIKIITLGGTVFLRGPVKSMEEKSQVEAHAKKVAGSMNVKNELEVVQK